MRHSNHHAPGGVGMLQNREYGSCRPLTIAVLVLFRGQHYCWAMATAKKGERAHDATYKKGERLLELRDLLFGKGIGLQVKVVSAHCLRWMDAARLIAPRSRGCLANGIASATPN